MTVLIKETNFMNQQPNIIFIIVHDLGQHIGCYGQKTVYTPNLDRLAEEGVRFQNSFCTAPQCSPSRAALYTGRYPHSNGVVGLAHDGFKEAFHKDEKPFQVILKEEAGYDTYLFGCQHATADTEFLQYNESYPINSASGGVRDCRDIIIDFDEFLKNRKSSNNYLAEINFHEPHHPFDLGGTLPDIEKGLKVPDYLADTEIAREEFAKYQGAIRKMDAAVGKVLESVENYCDMENTWIIFTTDHGSPFPLAKATLYDPGINTVLMMKYRGEGIGGGKVYNELISNVDIVPTIMEKLNIFQLDKIQGRSFWTLLKDGNYQKRQEIFAEKTYHCIYDPMRAIRTEGYKLIINFEIIPYFMLNPNIIELQIGIPTHPKYKKFREFIELYDLEKDPLERTNLALLEEYKDESKELTGRLFSWMKQTEDPLLWGPIPSATYTERVRFLKEQYE